MRTAWIASFSQARRSLLVWKLFGKRLDGFSNDDHPSESKPGAGDLVHGGKPVEIDKFKARVDIDFVGTRMPPPDDVASGKAKALSDEDRRTILRWIDLGCPIDRDYDPQRPTERGLGWMLDDLRPTLVVSSPVAWKNSAVESIVLGMHDYDSGLDVESLTVTADFAIDDAPAGTNLADKFRAGAQGVWSYHLEKPLGKLPSGTLTVLVKDRQGNTSRMERRIMVE